MRTNLFPLSMVLIALLAFSAGPTSAANPITFDDISTDYLSTSGGVTIVDYGTLAVITNGYQNLNWANFYVDNALRQESTYGTNGDYYGMLSISNVAFNGFGTPAEIDSAGTNFNFLSAYLTGAWNSNLNVEVEGFRSGTMLYDTTVVASATSPTLFTFNYMNIDQLVFNSFGGQPAGFPLGSGEQFAMDNLSLDLVPEPSSLLLAGFGALTLWPFLKRRRT